MQPASRFCTRNANLIVPTFTSNVKVGQPRKRILPGQGPATAKSATLPGLRPVAQVRERVVRANLGRANLGRANLG
jgi:hypothetical protein